MWTPIDGKACSEGRGRSAIFVPMWDGESHTTAPRKPTGINNKDSHRQTHRRRLMPTDTGPKEGETEREGGGKDCLQLLPLSKAKGGNLFHYSPDESKRDKARPAATEQATALDDEARGYSVLIRRDITVQPRASSC